MDGCGLGRPRLFWESEVSQCLPPMCLSMRQRRSKLTSVTRLVEHFTENINTGAQGLNNYADDDLARTLTFYFLLSAAKISKLPRSSISCVRLPRGGLFYGRN